MSSVVRSLVATGQVVRGVCYASPERFVGECALLRGIPPERLGLQGEYDHHGLAKRVKRRFYECFGRNAIAHVVVRQRGATVLISGEVSGQSLLQQMVDVAMAVDGATHVEVRDIQVNDAPSRSRLTMQWV